MTATGSSSFRKTSQSLAPGRKPECRGNSYDLYPAFPLDPGSIGAGFKELAGRLAGHKAVRIDGFVGVFWPEFIAQLRRALAGLGIHTSAIDVSTALKS